MAEFYPFNGDALFAGSNDGYIPTSGIFSSSSLGGLVDVINAGTGLANAIKGNSNQQPVVNQILTNGADPMATPSKAAIASAYFASRLPIRRNSPEYDNRNGEARLESYTNQIEKEFERRQNTAEQQLVSGRGSSESIPTASPDSRTDEFQVKIGPSGKLETYAADGSRLPYTAKPGVSVSQDNINGFQEKGYYTTPEGKLNNYLW